MGENYILEPHNFKSKTKNLTAKQTTIPYKITLNAP